MVNDVTLRVENWLGLYSFMVVPYDDFEVILNMDFFIKAKVFSLGMNASLVSWLRPSTKIL